MSKVIFSIQYELQPEKREEYLKAVKELSNLLKAEGLESYSVYEVKGKQNNFQEQYVFNSLDAFENFDDNTDERINILINKISDLAVDHTTKYTTMTEID